MYIDIFFSQVLFPCVCTSTKWIHSDYKNFQITKMGAQHKNKLLAGKSREELMMMCIGDIIQVRSAATL